jgi:hypothetical protein
MTNYMKYLLIFIIIVFTIIIGMHFLKTFHIVEGLENEEVAIPTEEVAMPTEEVAMPTEEVVMPTEEVVMPTEEVVMPTEEVVMPTEEVVMPTEEVVMPAKEVATISNESNVMQTKNEGKPITGHSLTTAPVTPYVTTTISVAPPVIQSQPKQNMPIIAQHPKQNIPIMKFNQHKQEVPAQSQPANIKSNKTISNTDNSKKITKTPINKKSF